MTWVWATLVLIAILGNLLNALELAADTGAGLAPGRPAARKRRDPGSTCWRSGT